MNRKIVEANKTDKFYIDRQMTDVLKGVAIIMMFALHFFAYPKWYIDYRFDNIEMFAKLFEQPLDMCVSIFAFITGYFYSFNRNKYYGYSFRKISDLYVAYIIVFVILLVPVLVFGEYAFVVSNFIQEVCVLRFSIMKFCWYVMFYFIAMLLLPLYSKLSDKHILYALLFGLVFPLLLYKITEKMGLRQIDVFQPICDDLRWLPAVFVGYIFAKWELFSSIFDYIFKRKIKSKIMIVLINIVIMAIAFTGPYLFPGFDYFGLYFDLKKVIYTPLFIYAIVNLCEAIKWKKVLMPISVLGKYSLIMWFVHCVFFNPLQKYTQPILYFPQNPILVLFWGLFISLIPSVGITKLVKFLNAKKNNLLFN